VTTLYFETFKEEEGLRQTGYSKDNKFNQPQIVIGLLVDKAGYPLAYDVYDGSTFEGHTILPIIKEFKSRFRIKKLAVVADAAMMSKTNLDDLLHSKIDYIIAARLGNIGREVLLEINKTLKKEDLANIRIKIDSKKYLICSYSVKRAKKDRRDRKKYIERAKYYLTNESKISKRSKYIKQKEGTFELNKELIKKHRLLEGIKGYYTNLKNLSNEAVIGHYHDLWRVEKSFRIAKTDLEMRPIYHYKNVAIKSHILISFISLCISKYMELETGLSVRRIMDTVKEVVDVEVYNKANGKFKTLRKEPDSQEHIIIKSNLLFTH
jgi:transposase